MFITSIRAIALVVIGISLGIDAHASVHTEHSVSVESITEGSSNVHTVVKSSGTASVDIVSIVNGETVLDIHERSRDAAKTSDTHVEFEGGAAHAHVLIDTDMQHDAPPRTHTTEKSVTTTDVRPIPMPPVPPAPIHMPLSEAPMPTPIIHLPAASIASYAAHEEAHNDPLVTRIMHTIAHTLTYVFTIFF